MPRYVNVDTVTFTNKDGKQFPVKDIRPIPDLTVIRTIDTKENDRLDEIASRRDIYGEDEEDSLFNIHDANVVKLVESKFDMSKIKKLKIPVRQ